METRQREASPAAECRTKRAAVARVAFGLRAQTSPARAPTRMRRAWLPGQLAAAYRGRAPGTARDPLTGEPTKTSAIRPAWAGRPGQSTRSAMTTSSQPERSRGHTSTSFRTTTRDWRRWKPRPSTAPSASCRQMPSSAADRYDGGVSRGSSRRAWRLTARSMAS